MEYVLALGFEQQPDYKFLKVRAAAVLALVLSVFFVILLYFFFVLAPGAVPRALRQDGLHAVAGTVELLCVYPLLRFASVGSSCGFL